MTIDIEAQYRPTHDERARQQFVSSLRKHTIIKQTAELKRRYDEKVEPALREAGQAPKSWRDIRDVMAKDHVHRFYSSTRYNVQEMCFMSVQPTVERVLPDMIRAAEQAAETTPAGGTLRLDPSLSIPKYVSALDVHLAPGYTHREYTENDVAQGAIISFGGRVFTGSHPYRKSYGTVGESVSYWIRRKYPDLDVRDVLDLGTTSGKNLLPFRDTFPNANLYGVDVGAPVLRYGHAYAEAEGVPAHFSQQNAESMDFEDASFDVITSSFFFHEIPLKVTKKVLAECARLLRPGGVMAHMELPNEAAVTDYENFFWNWDTQNNNEPYYTKFRAQDFHELCEEAGFEQGSTFANLVPDIGGNGEAIANECIDGKRETPGHGRGGWFVFGARKA